METHTRTDALQVYRELAHHYDQSGQPSMRDRFLILAADAALAAGHLEEAERLRLRLLHASRHHMLRAYPSFTEAVTTPDVQTYIRDLRLNYPMDTACALLERLRGGQPAVPHPAPPRAPAPAPVPAPQMVIPPTAPLIDLPPVGPSGVPAWSPLDIDPFQSARLPAPPQQGRRTDLPSPAPAPAGRRTNLGHADFPASTPPPRPFPALRTSEPSPPPSDPLPAPLPTPQPALVFPPAPPVQRVRPPLPDPLPEPEPPAEPSAGAWLGILLGLVVLLVGVSWAVYTLGRPFWPQG